MNDKNNIWAQVIATLQTRISQPELKTWFCGAALRSLEGSSALIEVPNKFHAAWLRSEYSDRLREAFHQITGTSPELVFCHAPVSAPEAVCGPSQASLPAEQPDSLNPDYTFEGFFTGAWNHFAYSCAQSAAMRPGQEYNPIHFSEDPASARPTCFTPSATPPGDNIRHWRPATSRQRASPASFPLPADRES